jgi:hypothetical protein
LTIKGGSVGGLARTLLPTLLCVALFAEHREFSAAQATKGAGQERHFNCDTDGVQLEGLLNERTFYGPPGFGETPAKDAQEKQLILKLEKPITVNRLRDVSADKSSCWGDFPNITKVQLFVFPPDKAGEARKLVGKMVVAEGKLHEGDAPSEHTKVVMDVSTVNPK